MAEKAKRCREARVHAHKRFKNLATKRKTPTGGSLDGSYIW